MLARYSRAGHSSDAAEEPVAADASSDAEVETIKAHAATTPLRADEQEAQELNALYGALAEATTGAGTPRDFMLAVSFAIQHVLPHDGIELTIGNSPEDQHYRLALRFARFGPIPSWFSHPTRLIRNACSVVSARCWCATVRPILGVRCRSWPTLPGVRRRPGR
jgi:hypothetical protein